MNRNSHASCPTRVAGFTLPAILVIVAALLILVIGLVSIAGIERRTARSYVELQRADMAARAGLEEVKGILDRETANDDFLVVADVPPLEDAADKNLEAVPYLYIARGEKSGSDVTYKYHPLFSAKTRPSATNPDLDDLPEALTFIGEDPAEIETLPYMNPAFGAWVPIKAKKNGKEQTVARYSYWVEDLQGKVNPKIAGNEKGDGNLHTRSVWPFPAPGLNSQPLSDKEPALDGIAIYALDPRAEEKPKGDLVKRVIDGRPLMLSPASILGASGFSPPLKRGDNGLPEDHVAAALERNVCPVVQAYDERPLIPYALGISANMAGQPKLNLNKLLGQDRKSAINQFTDHINKALPKFVEREGGFSTGDPLMNLEGDDYIKTLAANAFDYADADSEASLEAGVYRGLDAYPLMSELVLKLEYLGPTAKNNRFLLQFRFNLYVELWNITDQPVRGGARVSYEVGLPIEGIGTGVKGSHFDAVALLSDKNRSQHDLTQMDGRFYSREIDVNLVPDEYKFYKFATITYQIDIGPSNVSYDKVPFSLIENIGDAKGISLKWNSQEVERIPWIVRDPEGMNFVVSTYPKTTAKAAIPSHSFGPYGEFLNNMGDPRMSHYFRKERLGENSFPQNISPNRRNLRRGSVYDSSTSNYYGRVMPSEWPDGGHDSPYGIFPAFSKTDMTVEPDNPKYALTMAKLRENAPQRISNAGRFYSATELGRVYDPMMWVPHYDDLKDKPGTGAADTATVLAGGMPPRRNVFPDVSLLSQKSSSYGGGNTLRVGRYEHKRFDTERDGQRASFLLDLFHAGKSTSNSERDREADLVEINGQININTASKDALRAMAAGILKQDPQLREVTQWTHEKTNGRMAPRSSLLELGTPTKESAADVIADAVILRRPFASMGQLSGIRDANDEPVFGNPALYTQQKNPINWSDSAAEELFARIHDAGTFRSRNFRVWVIGQSLSGSEQNPEVLAETRKVFTVFADPGERTTDGAIRAEHNKSRVIYENDF